MDPVMAVRRTSVSTLHKNDQSLKCTYCVSSAKKSNSFLSELQCHIPRNVSNISSEPQNGLSAHLKSLTFSGTMCARRQHLINNDTADMALSFYTVRWSFI